MRQALGPGALSRPRGIVWRGRWEGGSGLGSTCKPMAVSFQCMTKSTTKKKKTASLLWHSAFFIVQLSYPYMTIGKTIALTRQTLECYSVLKKNEGFPGGPVAPNTTPSQCWGPGEIPDEGTRSHMPKLKVFMPQLKILLATQLSPSTAK